MTRNTWASPAYGGKWTTGNFTLRTKLVFVLGRTDSASANKIETEAKIHNDILLGPISFANFIPRSFGQNPIIDNGGFSTV